MKSVLTTKTLWAFIKWGSLTLVGGATGIALAAWMTTGHWFAFAGWLLSSALLNLCIVLWETYGHRD